LRGIKERGGGEKKKGKPTNGCPFQKFAIPYLIAPQLNGHSHSLKKKKTSRMDKALGIRE